MSVSGVEDGAAAGSDDQLIFLEEFCEDGGFELAEGCFTVVGEDFGD